MSSRLHSGTSVSIRVCRGAAYDAKVVGCRGLVNPRRVSESLAEPLVIGTLSAADKQSCTAYSGDHQNDDKSRIRGVQ